MASISSNERAILTARAGAARAGASRAGFCPVDTRGTTPGSSGGFYLWSRVYPASTTWTAVKR